MKTRMRRPAQPKSLDDAPRERAPGEAATFGWTARHYVYSRYRRDEIAAETLASFRQMLGLFAEYVGSQTALVEIERDDVLG